MTRVNLNDGTQPTPLSTEERHLDVIQELVEERDRLRAQLTALQAGHEAELGDMRKLLAMLKDEQVAAVEHSGRLMVERDDARDQLTALQAECETQASTEQAPPSPAVGEERMAKGHTNECNGEGDGAPCDCGGMVPAQPAPGGTERWLTVKPELAGCPTPAEPQGRPEQAGDDRLDRPLMVRELVVALRRCFLVDVEPERIGWWLADELEKARGR